ncbi:MAG: TIGR03617 family F420-dependent LLM class oxidoreductase [Actinomycetota bacterium]|nr:TIGR03617 family F420-dependent LLM class oxidoreductase [Actinomycetota bacterium]
MKFDLMSAGAELRSVQDLARRAERGGFSGIVFTESGRSAYLSTAAAALATETLELSTGIAVAFPRSPMVTAVEAWELAEASGGRFRLGLGTQVKAHIERRYSSEFAAPGPRLREYVEAVRAAFAAFAGDSKLDVSGRFYEMNLLPAQWSPGPIECGAPPIDVAAVGEWMLRMAGAVADGVHVHPLNTPTYLAETVQPQVARGAREAGRDPSEIALIVPAFTVVGDTPEEQERWRRMARTQISFYGSTPNYAFIFDQLGFEGTTAAIRERQKAGDIAGMAEVITDEILDHFAITARWDDLSDQIVKRYGGVADRVVSYFAAMAAHDDPTVLDRWGEVARDVVARTGG